MPKKKVSARGKRYTAAQKQKILQTALAEKMTGEQVQKRFGVSALTFYRWRGPVRRGRKRGPGRPPGSKTVKVAQPNLGWFAKSQGTLRDHVRASLGSVMPQMIRDEIQSYLREIFGPGSNGHTAPRRRRKRGRPRKLAAK